MLKILAKNKEKLILLVNQKINKNLFKLIFFVFRIDNDSKVPIFSRNLPFLLTITIE